VLFRSLSIGLDILSEESSLHINCPTFEAFAVDVGVVAAEDTNKCEEDDIIVRNHLEELDRFFKSCLGWKTCLDNKRGDFQNILVSDAVISKWIAASCTRISSEQEEDVDGGGRDILLGLLIALATSCHKANREFAIVSQKDTSQLLLEAWFRCGDVWDKNVKDRLSSSSGDIMPFEIAEIMNSVIDAARKHLNNVLVSSCNKKSTNIIRWSRQGLELIEIQKMILSRQGMDLASHLIHPLDLVGLGDVENWKLCHNNEAMAFAYASFLITLLEVNHCNGGTNIDNAELVVGGKTVSEAKLFVQICMACIGASRKQSTIQILLYKNKSKAERLIRLLGSKDSLDNDFFGLCCNQILLSLEFNVKYEQTEGALREVRLSVECLDFLCGLMLGSMLPFVQSKIKAAVNPFKVNTGDVLWYVLKDDDEEITKKVIVSRIHDDDHPNPPYFTIRFVNGEILCDSADVAQEKQTVAGRLRSCASNTLASFIPKRSELSKHLERRIVEFGIGPVFSNRDTLLFGDTECVGAVAEILNIVISRFGLLREVGVGSTRYSVFQLTSSLQKSVVALVKDQVDYYKRKASNDPLIESSASEPSNSTEQICKCARELYFLALAMGGGVLTEPSICNFEILHFDPSDSVSVICELYSISCWQYQRSQLVLPNDCEINFELASMMWLAVATSATTDGETLNHIAAAMNEIAQVIFKPEEWDKEHENYRILFSLTMMTGLENICQQGTNIAFSSSLPIEVPSALNLVRCFVDIWDVYDSNDENEHAQWHFLFLPLLRRRTLIPSFATGARKYANRLCEALYLEQKRWFGYQLLHMVSIHGLDVDIGGKLSMRSQKAFQLWSSRLPPEEVEELEEDIHTTSRLLPSFLMDELLNWNEENEIELDEALVMGRFLSWLVFLDLLDGFSKIDVKNRGAMISYAQHTSAGRYILSLSAQYSTFENHGRKNSDGTWMSCTSLEEDPSTLALEPLATMVFFRSVQALPTVVKSWWNENCHRSLQQKVSQFVEAEVSPETLRQELRRIKAAENLGDMHVSGSVVSREVSAVYEQDEVRRVKIT